MFLKSFLISVLMFAFGCQTLPSQSELKLPTLRFLKSEKVDYKNIYWFYFMKNTTDSTLYIKMRSSNNDTSIMVLGNNYFRKWENDTLGHATVSTHAGFAFINKLNDTVLIKMELSNSDIAFMDYNLFKNSWKLGTDIFQKGNKNSPFKIWSDEIPPIE
jgi:hypothetical protein